MDFDLAGVFAEGGIGANVGGGGPGLSCPGRSHGVHAIAGDQRLSVAEVGGGKAERLAAPLAGDHGTRDAMMPAEQRKNHIEPACDNLAANPAARNRLALL